MISCKTSSSLHENIGEIAPSSQERRVSGRKDRSFVRKSRKGEGKNDSNRKKGGRGIWNRIFDRHGNGTVGILQVIAMPEKLLRGLDQNFLPFGYF